MIIYFPRWFQLTVLKHRHDKYLIKCLILSAITAALSLLYFIIAGHGELLIASDYINQQIPFSEAARSIIREGGQWVWGMDLGASSLTAFGFGLIGSPFFLLTLPFSEGSFPYLAGILYILKYIVASVCAYLYLCIFIKDRKFAVLGALLYAFSGFQSTNHMFYNFHDSVAFFPLLLSGAEKLREDDRSLSFFSFAVFINCTVNYFFFVEEVIFLVIYFFFRFIPLGSKKLFRSLISFAVCGIIGIMASGLIFFPNLLFVLGNIRSEAYLFSEYLTGNSNSFLYILKGMLLPADTMTNSSAVYSDYSSTCCYLPLCGMPLALSYIRGKKTWLRSMLILLLLISFSPLFQSVFVLFSLIYQRWWFMLTLLMALSASVVMEHPQDYPVKSSALIFLALLAVFAVIVVFLPWNYGFSSLVFNLPRFLLLYVLSALGVIALLIPDIFSRKRLLALLTVSACAVTTALPLYWYRQSTDTEDFQERFELSFRLPKNDPQYRYRSGDNVLMLAGNNSGVAMFSSTVENSSFRFDSLLGLYRKNGTLGRLEREGVPELLGGKYSLTALSELTGEEKDILPIDGSGYAVVPSDACPIGFACEGYITESEFAAVPDELKPQLLMKYICVKDGASLTGFEHISSAPETMGTLEESIRVCADRAVKNFIRSSQGFCCTSYYDEDRLVWFSVPYSKGWSASLDGEKLDIMDSAGMMAVKVPYGSHSLEFSYRTPLYNAGLAASAAGAILLMFMALYEKKHRK